MTLAYEPMTLAKFCEERSCEALNTAMLPSVAYYVFIPLDRMPKGDTCVEWVEANHYIGIYLGGTLVVEGPDSAAADSRGAVYRFTTLAAAIHFKLTFG